MKKSLLLRSVIVVSGLLWMDLIAGSSDKVPSNAPIGAKTSRVAAQVVDSNSPGSSQPERQAGTFRIPDGSLGVNLEYRYRDPNADFSSTRLSGTNLFSVTENRYLRELEFVPIYKLPPGDYRFEVGGMPGAHGELTVSVVPDTPPAITSGTKSTPPPTADKPPGTADDAEIAETKKALTRTWSGLYTIEKITGNVAGLGEVRGKRYFSVKMRPDEFGVSVEGAVWMPPGWSGQAAGAAVNPGRVVRFFVVSKQIGRGVLSISYTGVYDPKTDSIKGTLIGNRVSGDSIDPVFEGSFYLKPK